MKILRHDGQPDHRGSEIPKDWRTWAKQNGYRPPPKSETTRSGGNQLVLELWNHPGALSARFLLYVLLSTEMTRTETLYLLDTFEQLQRAREQAYEKVFSMMAEPLILGSWDTSPETEFQTDVQERQHEPKDGEEQRLPKQEDYTTLFERIRAHCQRRQWYGPDQSSVYGSMLKYDLRTSFFPCATEDQMRRSEEIVGYAYPPLLRSLYLEVANGGFGPGTGLFGVLGGYRDAIHQAELRSHSLPVQEDQSCIRPDAEMEPLFDLEQYEREQGYPKVINLSSLDWPSKLIRLCDWGCGYTTELHARTGRVYYSGDDILYFQTDSLVDWLESWLRGEDLEALGEDEE